MRTGLLLSVVGCCATGGAAPAAPAATAAVRARAMSAYAGGRFDEAAHAAAAVLTASSNRYDAGLLTMLGRSYYELQQWSNALTVLQQVRADSAAADYAEAQYFQGCIHELHEDLPRALFAYDAAAHVPNAAPFTTLAAHAAARLYLARGAPGAAHAVLTNQPVGAADAALATERAFWLAQCALLEGNAPAAYDQFSVLNQRAEIDPTLRPYLAGGALMAAEAASHAAAARKLALPLSATGIPARVRALALHHLGRAAFRDGDLTAARGYLLACLTTAYTDERANAPYLLVVPEGFPYAEALYTLGQMALRAHKPGGARVYFERCADAYPHHALAPKAALQVAQLTGTHGADSNVIVRLQQAGASADTKVRLAALILLADLARTRTNFADALAYLAQAAACASNTPAAHDVQFRLGLTHYAQGNYSLAQQTFERVFATAPAGLREDAHFWCFWCLLQQNLLDDARTVLQEHTMVFPTGQYVWAVQLQRGRLAVARGDFAGASVFFQTVATNPVDRALAEHALHELALAHAQQGHTEQALSVFTDFLSEFPTSPLRDAVEFKMGLTFFSMGDYTRAHGALAALAARAPHGSYAGQAAYWAAAAADRLGKHQSCETTLTTHWAVIVQSPDAAAAWLLRGDCYRAAGALTQAWDAYQAAARMPDAAISAGDAQFRLGDCALALSNSSAALAIFIPLSSNADAQVQARALVALGDARAAGGDLRAALSEWLRVVYDFPGQTQPATRAARRAAAAYVTLNEPQQAERILHARATRLDGAPP
ncbi:MAG: tetratricopeptide repeat protein, partial [bacterium]|nr:tetratricopeptide repeat protein [bacterium]